MNTKKILVFLRALEENNSLEWMHANKESYREAKGEFENLLNKMIGEIAVWDSAVAHLEGKDIVYRLNRDTRFGNDKRPYNPAFRAHISPGGKAPIPAGYYLQVKPGGSFLGGGVHAVMFPEAVGMVRDHIRENGDRFQAIVSHPDFTQHFQITGAKLKRVPAGFDKEHPLSEYFKHKSWDLEVPAADQLVEDKDAFIEYACGLYRKMKPFHQFLNEGLVSFRMPKR